MHDNIADSSQHVENGLSMTVIKTSPPVIATGAILVGIQLQDWLIIATIIYTVIQIIIELPKLKKSFNEWREK